MTKLKNSNGDETQKLKWRQNLQVQVVTKLKTQIVTNLNKLNCDKTKKNQIVTKVKNSNCDKSQKLKL